MKKNLIKTIAKKSIISLSTRITKLEVNSTCPLIAYQPKIPEAAKELKKI